MLLLYESIRHNGVNCFEQFALTSYHVRGRDASIPVGPYKMRCRMESWLSMLNIVDPLWAAIAEGWKHLSQIILSFPVT